MGVSIRPEVRNSPVHYLLFLRETNPEKAALYEEFLRETNRVDVIRTAMRQEQWSSGELARRHQQQAEADPQTTPQTGTEAVAPIFNSAFDSGTFGLAGLAADALSPGTFRANRDARQAAYNAMPAKERILSSVAGGLPWALMTGGAPAASYLSAAGRGVVSGAAQGAATGLGENVGTSSGALVPTLMGAAVGGAAGGVLSPLARALGAKGGPMGRMVAGGQQVDDFAFPTALREMADAGNVGIELPVVPTDHRAFRPTGFSAPTPHAPVAPNHPTPMALDVMNPEGVARVAGAVESVPARETLRAAFEARANEAPQALGRAFDAATGTTAADADQLALQLAQAERNLASANASQKAQYEAMVQQLRQRHANAVAQARAVQAPARPQPKTITDALDALSREGGGEDAIPALQRMLDERHALAKRVYGDAWDATKGEIVDSDVISAILKTREGRRAFNEAVASRPNISALDRSRAMPTVEKFDGPDLVDVPVPDAEALHFMKQQLANWARLSPDAQAASGINGKSAAEALDLFQLLREELPDVVRQADAAYAGASAPITALKEGLARHGSNPTNLNRALTTVEQRASGMAEEPLSAFQLGQRHKVESLFRGGLSPSRAASLLSDPRSDLAREVALGYGPDAPARLAQALRTPDPVPFQRPAVVPFVSPPKPQPLTLSPDLAAARRGLDVPGTPRIPSAKNLERSLPTLAQDVAGMSPAERGMLQRGAAAGFRRDIGGLNLSDADRMAQFRYAAPNPALAADMAGAEGAWRGVLDTQRRVLPNSQLRIGPESESLLHRMFEGLAANPAYTAVRTGRELTSRSMAAGTPRRIARDVGWTEMAKFRPESLADALGWLAQQDAVTDGVSRMGGRTAGAGAGTSRDPRNKR